MKSFLVENKVTFILQLVPWLLMSWWRQEPGHQQSWYWPSPPRPFLFQHQKDYAYFKSHYIQSIFDGRNTIDVPKLVFKDDIRDVFYEFKVSWPRLCLWLPAGHVTVLANWTVVYRESMLSVVLIFTVRKFSWRAMIFMWLYHICTNVGHLSCSNKEHVGNDMYVYIAALF